MCLAYSQSPDKLSTKNRYVQKHGKNAEDRAQVAERSAQSAEHRAQSTECRAQSTWRRAQSTNGRAQSAEHRAQSTERRAQSAAKISLDIKNKKWFETLIRSKVFLKNKKNARLWAQKTFLI